MTTANQTLRMYTDPDTGETFLPANVAGRHASQVQVKRGVYTGLKGTVVRIHHPGAIMVRFGPGSRYAGTTVPCGAEELGTL